MIIVAIAGCDGSGPEGISGGGDEDDLEPSFAVKLSNGEEFSFQESLTASTESSSLTESSYMKRVSMRTERSGPGFSMDVPFREGKHRLGTVYSTDTEAQAKDVLTLRTSEDVVFQSAPQHRGSIPESEYVEPWVQIDEITSDRISGRLGGTLLRQDGDAFEHVTITEGHFTVTGIQDDHPDIEDASADAAVWPYDGDDRPVEITMVHGDYQDGHPEHGLRDSLVVQITDADGYPVMGRTVEFSSPQGGTFHSGQLETDIDGLAWVTWVLGPFHGRHTIIATTDGIDGSGVEFGAWSTPAPPSYTGPYAEEAHGRIDAATTLTWEINNPTPDELVFDLYMSSVDDSDLELVEEGLEAGRYEIELATNAKYFWTVVTRVPDNGDLFTYGDTTSLITGGWSANRVPPMQNIPEGAYPRGETGYSHTLYYDYEISTIEVTNGMYARWLIDLMATNDVSVSGRKVFGFVEIDNPFASDGTYMLLDMASNSSRIHWNEANQTFAIDYGFADHPVTFVTWYGAKAYAQSKGFHLPSTYEWEKAARGPWRPDAYDYPWGSTAPKCGMVNYDFCYSGTRHTGSFPNYGSYYRLADMAGNVWEWTESNGSPPNEPFFTPIIRGGGFRSDADAIKAWNEVDVIPSHRGADVGFRVVDVIERKYTAD